MTTPFALRAELVGNIVHLGKIIRVVHSLRDASDGYERNHETVSFRPLCDRAQLDRGPDSFRKREREKESERVRDILGGHICVPGVSGATSSLGSMRRARVLVVLAVRITASLLPPLVFWTAEREGRQRSRLISWCQ